ncbi:MAG: DUF2236 domain-containing protein [Myxococcales bacterium]|nr:DUF2236 domain-containing protein [Myxococcales bacterium]
MTSSPIPARVHDLERARAQHGDLIDRFIPFLWRTDPLADAAVDELDGLRGASPGRAGQWIDAAIRGEVAGIPESVRALVDACARAPLWVDRGRVERAGKLFYRAGLLGAVVLALRSLVGGYAAPVGNKPLALSGRLLQAAPRRLSETSKFVAAVCAPGGMAIGGDGYRITLKVRLMHARVRALVRRSDRWDLAAWAEPINQHDMVATILLFSKVFLDGLRLLGLRVEPGEGDDYVHLWRYVGFLIGVEPELLPADEREAARLADVIQITQGPPDDDSRALADALLGLPIRQARTPEERRKAEVVVHMNHVLARMLLGDALADGLALRRHATRHALPLLHALLRGSESVRARLPGAERLARWVGARYWASVIDEGLRGQEATFDMPDRLTATA